MSLLLGIEVCRRAGNTVKGIARKVQSMERGGGSRVCLAGEPRGGVKEKEESRCLIGH